MAKLFVSELHVSCSNSLHIFNVGENVEDIFTCENQRIGENYITTLL
jgi:hypothetical protein